MHNGRRLRRSTEELPRQGICALHLCARLWKSLFRRSHRSGRYLFALHGQGKAGLSCRRGDLRRHGTVQRQNRSLIVFLLACSFLASCNDRWRADPEIASARIEKLFMQGDLVKAETEARQERQKFAKNSPNGNGVSVFSKPNIYFGKVEMQTA